MYQYVFTKKPVLNVSTKEICLETPPSLPPLAKAQKKPGYINSDCFNP